MSAKVHEALPVAQYARKSTEHQRYSLETQFATIQTYADARGFSIVRSYVDAGRSGLKIAGRAALQQLLSDVQTGDVPYRAILVYDVSRWGRFQNVDESAYYEYACKRAGVSVHYCAEQFDNDGTVLSAIIKNLKRAMAAEYSRELGVRVFAGHKRATEQGFYVGPVGYGLRRMLVGADGEPKHLMRAGERKHLTTDRTILVPGPKEEVEVLLWIFDQAIRHGKYETAIARELNRRGVPTGLDKPWDYHLVRRILKNPKYAGENIWNRTSQRLRRAQTANPQSQWVRHPLPFEPIIQKHIFEEAQQVLVNRKRRATKEEVLRGLGVLLKREGSLSANVIDRAIGSPSYKSVVRQFGSLREVNRLLAHYPFARRKALRDLHWKLIGLAHVELERQGLAVRVKHGERHSLLIQERVTLHVIMLRRWEARLGPRWRLWRRYRTAKGFVLAVRMGQRAQAPAELYLFPPSAIRALPVTDLGPDDFEALEPYRLKSLRGLRPRTLGLPAPTSSTEA